MNSEVKTKHVINAVILKIENTPNIHIYMSLCKFEIKTYRKAIHEKSVGHQYYLQQHEKNEEPEKPDVIYLHNGVRHFMCFGCKTCCVESMWGSHMLGKNGVEHFENKKKYEEKKRANPNSDEMKINRFWLRKSIA